MKFGLITPQSQKILSKQCKDYAIQVFQNIFHYIIVIPKENGLLLSCIGLQELCHTITTGTGHEH